MRSWRCNPARACLGRRIENGSNLIKHRTPSTRAITRSSTLASAILVLKRHGIGRQLPLLLGILLTGVLDGIGIAALFPALTIVVDTGGEPSRLHRAVIDVLGILGIAPNLELFCGAIVACLVLKAMLQLVITRRVGR
jgi:ATP-binding cassette subfamily C protein